MVVSQVACPFGRVHERVPRVRLRAVPDRAVLVVRGDELTSEILLKDASNFHERSKATSSGCGPFRARWIVIGTCSTAALPK